MKRFLIVLAAVLLVSAAATAAEIVTKPGTDKGPVPHHRQFKYDNRYPDQSAPKNTKLSSPQINAGH